jgi:hypothetical protein
MNKLTFDWRPEARISIDAQVAGEELEVIKERNDGMITPEAVVTAARAKMSPLHPYFEWDDSIAAAKHRLEQSRYLIRHLVVQIDEVKQPEAHPVRAFVQVERKAPSTGKPEAGYMPIRTVMGDAELRGQVLRRAVSELKGWQARYTEMQELARVFDAIEQTALELQA